MDRTWTLLCEKAGARYVRHPMPPPLTTHAAFVDRLWSAVTPRTRIVFLSHIRA